MLLIPKIMVDNIARILTILLDGTKAALFLNFSCLRSSKKVTATIATNKMRIATDQMRVLVRVVSSFTSRK